MVDTSDRRYKELQEEIKHLESVLTFVGGKSVYAAEEFSDTRRALEVLEAETPAERQNVDVLRRIVEAAGRKDYQAVLVDLDPEVEIDDTDIPEATGGDSFLEWVARWDEAWEMSQSAVCRFLANRLESFDPSQNFRAYLYTAAGLRSLP